MPPVRANMSSRMSSSTPNVQARCYKSRVSRSNPRWPRCRLSHSWARAKQNRHDT